MATIKIRRVFVGLVILIASFFISTSCEKEVLKPNEIAVQNYSGLSFIDLVINGKKGRFLVDTGANMSYINYGDLSKFKILVRSHELETELSGIGGPGESVYLLHNFKLIKIDGEELPNNIPFRSTDLSKVGLNISGIIGGDYLRKNKAIVDYRRSVIILNGQITN